MLTITNNDRNVPRIPKTRDVMKSFRMPLTRWTLADLGLTADVLRAGTYADIVDLSIPRKEGACEFVTGNTLEERIDAFAGRVLDVVRSS